MPSLPRGLSGGCHSQSTHLAASLAKARGDPALCAVSHQPLMDTRGPESRPSGPFIDKVAAAHWRPPSDLEPGHSLVL